METPGVRLYRNAWFEARLVLGVWFLFLVWVIGYCWARAYEVASDPAAVPPVTRLGMPEWIFYGIALPWLLATVLSILMGALIIRDDDLAGPIAPDNKSPGAS